MLANRFQAFSLNANAMVETQHGSPSRVSKRSREKDLEMEDETDQSCNQRRRMEASEEDRSHDAYGFGLTVPHQSP